MSLLVSALTWSGVAAVVISLGWLLAKRAGRVEAEKKAAEASSERARIRHEVDEDVARLSAAELDDELYGPKR